MKLRDLLEMANNNPELLDYTLNLSDYIVVPDEGGEDYDIVSDFPIRGIATHEEEKELRFVLTRSDIYALEKSNDQILAWVDAQKERKRDDGIGSSEEVG